MTTDAVQTDRYQLANAADKIEGYFLPRASDVHDRSLRAFDRAKDECIHHLTKQLQTVQAMTFDQFCAVKKIKVTSSCAD